MSIFNHFKTKTRTHYIWIRGVIIWGGFMFVSNCLFDLYTGTLQPNKLVIRLILCTLLGYVFGLFLWRYAEKKVGLHNK